MKILFSFFILPCLIVKLIFAQDLFESPEEIVFDVKAKRKPQASYQTMSKTPLQKEQIQHLPQGSEVALSKLITATTPGVVAGPFGQMFFRGNHGNVQYQIDNIPLPDAPSNTLSQAFSPRNIQSMEILTGGFPAEYGLRLSSVVSIQTRSGLLQPQGEFELNYGTYQTLSPHLIYGGSSSSGKMRYFLSLNFFQTQRGLDTPQPESLTDDSQGGSESIHNKAYGHQQFFKGDWSLSDQDDLTFLMSHSYGSFQIPNYPSSFSPNDELFQSHDHLAHAHQSSGFSVYRPDDTHNVQSEHHAFLQLAWKRKMSDIFRVQWTPYYQYSQIQVTADPVRDLWTAPGGVSPMHGSSATSFSMNRHVNHVGLRNDYHLKWHEQHTLKTGFQLQASRADGFFQVQRSLDDSVPQVGDSHPVMGYFESLYLQDEFVWAQPFSLNLGLRWDATQFRFADLKTSDHLLQPRLGLSYLCSEQTKIHLYYGKLFQPSAIENLRTTFNALQPHPQPYDIQAEKDDYWETGLEHSISQKQKIQLNFYYKLAENMLDEAQLLNTSIYQPFNYRKGYAYGAELSWKGQLHSDWSHRLNYSYSIAEGKGISGGAWAMNEPVSDQYQLLDHVQKHTCNASLTYAKDHYWWTHQLMFGSGLRTGEYKELSLPSYWTWDMTLGYEFPKKTSLFSGWRVSIDALNLFDRRYPITLANGYNGSHYAAGRQAMFRLTKIF